MRKVIEEKLWQSVSDDYLWDLFKRHNWRKKLLLLSVQKTTGQKRRV
jgi:hypothetical protein